MSLDTLKPKVAKLIEKAQSGGGNWYDFTVTVASEPTNGQELLDVFIPYLSNFENGKDIAIFTLMNENIVADEMGTALLCVISSNSLGSLQGKMLRYRSSTTLLKNVTDMTTGYGITPYAGAVYYAKVVRVIA